MVTSLISTLGGALFGGVQNYLQQSQDNKKEIEIAKIQSENQIKLAELNITQYKAQESIQESKTIETQYNTEARVKEVEKGEYEAFVNAVTQQTGIWQSDSKFAEVANFIIVTTRPIVTYILLILVFIVALKIIKNIEVTENHLMIFDLILAEFSAVMSYWFVRRSFEKKYTPQLQKKN